MNNKEWLEECRVKLKEAVKKVDEANQDLLDAEIELEYYTSLVKSMKNCIQSSWTGTEGYHPIQENRDRAGNLNYTGTIKSDLRYSIYCRDKAEEEYNYFQLKKQEAIAIREIARKDFEFALMLK